MIEKVKQYVEKYHMISEGDTIVAGISGGADSVCLLLILLRLQRMISFRLCAVHVNHKIRPEAGEDVEYVKRLCELHGCSFYCVERDVLSYAEEKRISTEEAGRILRYEAFGQVLAGLGCPGGKIAVAHNRNDNAETVLFHMFRGTGISGMSGIRPVRGRIIRPLLCVERREIEEFLRVKGVSFCIDRTNQEDTYTRNRIRRHILPYAEKEVCGRSVEHICRMAEIMGEAGDYIRKNAEEAFARCAALQDGTISLDTERFLREHYFLQKQILLLCMERLACGGKDIGAVHIGDIHSLFLREANRQTDLPYGLRAVRKYGEVWIGPAAAKEKYAPAAVEAVVPGSVIWPGLGRVEFTLFSREGRQNIPQKTYTKWFDYDKIVKSLMLRTRETGDYLTINSRMDRQSLKKYFIQEKISREDRGGIPLLADGSHILWVVGYRISEAYKVDGQTKNILQVQITGGTQDG